MPCVGSSADASVAPPSIACTVHAPASVKTGQPVSLKVVLHNRGATKISVLNWGTPFEEAWLQPFVTVTRDGKPVAYEGAVVKRGDPERDEYFGLSPAEQREASIDLTLAFDLTEPGPYVVVPRIVLYDVALEPVRLPRARASHQPRTIDCNTIMVTVRPKGQTR